VQDLEKQDLENPARKEVFKKNFAKNQDLENAAFEKQDLENPARKEVFRKNFTKNNSEKEQINNKIDINKLIISLKNSGFSAKKIQYDLKKNYNYETTQQNIREII
jgi:hypothetical protein